MVAMVAVAIARAAKGVDNNRTFTGRRVALYQGSLWRQKRHETTNRQQAAVHHKGGKIFQKSQVLQGDYSIMKLSKVAWSQGLQRNS